MNPEKHRLLSELLDDAQAGARRQATLLGASRVLRRKRWRRVGIRCSAVAVPIAIVALLMRPQLAHRLATSPAPPASKPPVRSLSDDQLLALFPNTPVGLATVGDRKVLIFPRAEDRERFVGKF